VLVSTVLLAAFLLALGVVTALRPGSLPLCFAVPGEVVCPTGENTVPQGNPDQLVASVASGWDYGLVVLMGIMGAALGATITLRNMRGITEPYGVPLGLVVLKLPSGGLSAVTGLLLLRGQFVPGLVALDSPAQILAYAILFGYGQQLATRFVDQQGQALLDAAAPSSQEPERKDPG
jgi:hypothetical protein